MATTKFASPIVVAEVLLEAQECGICGVIYALTRDFIATRHKDSQSWFCPNGHQWHYSEDEADRLRKEKAQLEQQVASERGWSKHLSEKLETEKKSHAATKGQLTKTRKRVQNGVCPDCNRHFANLERHMHDKHPVQEPTA